MNPIYREAAVQFGDATFMGVLTILFIGVFLGWAWWAWRPANRELMERYGAMALDDEPPGGDL